MKQTPSDVAATGAASSEGASWFGTFETNFVTPQLNRIVETWHAKRGARTMPARSAFDIRDLKFALPNIAMLDIVREGETIRYRARLVGSLLETFVAPMTGRFIDEAVPQHFANKWSQQWLPAIAERRFMRAVGRVEFAGRRWYVAESAFAPMASDGETPDILMVVVFYHSTDGEPASHEFAARLVAEIDARGRNAH